MDPKGLIKGHNTNSHHIAQTHDPKIIISGGFKGQQLLTGAPLKYCSQGPAPKKKKERKTVGMVGTVLS